MMPPATGSSSIPATRGPSRTSRPAARADDATAPCASCGRSGCDVRVVVVVRPPAAERGAPSALLCRHYHARCFDAASFAEGAASAGGGGADSSASEGADASAEDGGGAAKVEIVPLSFAEMDRARRLGDYASKIRSRMTSASAGGSSDFLDSSVRSSASHPSSSGGGGGKRPHARMRESEDDLPGGPSCYDPASPRIGKWSPDEIAFRDALEARFVEGSLPLPDGSKLVDFLATTLRSKPSRLTKKMKRAKLSSRIYRTERGFLEAAKARELSDLEHRFVDSIPDPVERSEVRFHMSREWRERIADRLTSLGIAFDAGEWLRSVDKVDRRIQAARGRDRAAKRRFMMGRAAEVDERGLSAGVFMDATAGDERNSGPDASSTAPRPKPRAAIPAAGRAAPGAHAARSSTGSADFTDFDVLASGLDADDCNDAELRELYSSLADDPPVAHVATAAEPEMGVGGAGVDSSGRASYVTDASATPDPPRPVMTLGVGTAGTMASLGLGPPPAGAANATSALDALNGLAGSLGFGAAAGPPPVPSNLSHQLDPDLAGQLHLPPPGLSSGPNFRHAAPFLSAIVGYLERRSVPFEHVDVWVPSTCSSESSSGHLDPTGATAPEPSLLGSGSARNQAGRLCFAGSASAGVRVVPPEELENAAAKDGDGASCSDGSHRSGSVGGSPGPGALRASPVPAVAPLRASPRPSPGQGNLPTTPPVVAPLTPDESYHLSLFGSYSEKFSFNPGCGLPGRVHASGRPAWERRIQDAPSELFERRGGAMQFGIMTALGLPVDSPNAGRIVVVLYSRHDRVQDEGLVARMVRDLGGLNPRPRWKLAVDMGNGGGGGGGGWGGRRTTVEERRRAAVDVAAAAPAANAASGLSRRNSQISNLIALLGENIPSDDSNSPLGPRVHDIMSLRLVLLKVGRTTEEELLVDSLLTLFESYVGAGRSRQDIAALLARDYAFHSLQQQQQHQQQHHLAQMRLQRQTTVPGALIPSTSMQYLSLGPPAIPQPQSGSPPLVRLDHTNHQGRNMHPGGPLGGPSPSGPGGLGSLGSLNHQGQHPAPSRHPSPPTGLRNYVSVGSLYHQTSLGSLPPGALSTGALSSGHRNPSNASLMSVDFRNVSPQSASLGRLERGAGEGAPAPGAPMGTPPANLPPS
ncbi:hypothetical protein ACHAWF_007710 [Thalassiosira exigua]